jgi:hypothetical protein
MCMDMERLGGGDGEKVEDVDGHGSGERLY